MPETMYEIFYKINFEKQQVVKVYAVPSWEKFGRSASLYTAGNGVRTPNECPLNGSNDKSLVN